MMPSPSDVAAPASTFHLLVWDAGGRRLLDRPLGSRTLAVSGRPDADARVAELGGGAAFLRPSGRGVTLFLHDEAGKEEHVALAPGLPASLGGLTWLVTAVERPADADAGEAGDDLAPADASAPSRLLADVVAWASRPMDGVAELRAGLRDFLRVLVERAPAASGMLVLAEGEGFSLATACGLSPRDAQKLWEKMPASLVEEVLRAKARMLLPDELRRAAGRGTDTTVFVRGVRSVAGFPVLAEGRLVALFFLGFDNLLRRLSPELQRALEDSAGLLGLVVQRAQLREQIEALKLKAASTADVSLPSGRLMVGAAPRLVEVYRLLSRLAPVDVATLVLGETGTGKELAAKELHRLSARGKGPFVVVNAAALPETLIESELFGHKKGAFTGALTDRVGLVEQAHGGTLFIDEIGELPQPMQAKLLRVLQERAVTRIGEAQPRAVDFRLVSATHRDLATLVQQGLFREDLYYRLAGATIRMPSLRERPEDVLTLANYFRQQFAERHGLPDKEWSTEALDALAGRAWPGNVRELENVVARAFVMAEGNVIRARDLGPGLGGAGDDATQGSGAADRGVGGFAGDPAGDAGLTLEAARDAWTRAFLKRALQRHNGRRSETAKALGIGERTLFRYLEQLDLGEV